MTSSAIQASESDTATFLNLLERISAQQTNICKALDELLLLMEQPSADVLKVLARLLAPMGRDMDKLTEQVKIEIVRSTTPPSSSTP